MRTVNNSVLLFDTRTKIPWAIWIDVTITERRFKRRPIKAKTSFVRWVAAFEHLTRQLNRYWPMATHQILHFDCFSLTLIRFSLFLSSLLAARRIAAASVWCVHGIRCVVAKHALPPPPHPIKQRAPAAESNRYGASSACALPLRANKTIPTLLGETHKPIATRTVSVTKTDCVKTVKVRATKLGLLRSVPLSSTPKMASLATFGRLQIVIEIGVEGVFKVRFFCDKQWLQLFTIQCALNDWLCVKIGSKGEAPLN